jgi:hypothetical protein
VCGAHGRARAGTSTHSPECSTKTPHVDGSRS